MLANGNITFSVNVKGIVAGPQNDTTSAVTSNEAGSGNSASASVTVTVPGGMVNGKQIGDNNAQRSMVTSITLTFASAIPSNQLSSALADLSLTMTANDATDPGPFISTANPSQLKLLGALDSTGTKLTLTFTGSSILGGSLPDGRYTLAYGGNTVYDAQHLFRLFGDLDGANGYLTAYDYNVFTTTRYARYTRVAPGTTQEPVLQYMDSGYQGAYTQADLNAFLLRYSTYGYTSIMHPAF